MAIPNASWQVRLDLPPQFEVENVGLAVDDGGPRIRAGDVASGVSVTAYGGRVLKGEDAAAYRDRTGSPKALKSLTRAMRRAFGSRKVEVRDRRTWDEGDHAWLAYAAVMPDGRAHRSLNLVLVHDGSWIHVQASKEPAVPADDAVLEAILRTARIEVP